MKNILKPVLFALCLVLSSVSADAKVIYVDSASTATSPTGLSWTSAYKDFNTAFANAVDGDELWFAKGTYNMYTPGGRALDLDLSFAGGFKGNETSLMERDLINFKTTFISNNGSAPYPSGASEWSVYLSWYE